MFILCRKREEGTQFEVVSAFDSPNLTAAMEDIWRGWMLDPFILEFDEATGQMTKHDIRVTVELI